MNAQIVPRSGLKGQGARVRTHSFCGLGAAGIQAVSWARQREVAGFCTGPAAVLGPGGALLPAGGAAIRAAASGLGDGRAQDLGRVAGRDSRDVVWGRREGGGSPRASRGGALWPHGRGSEGTG